MTDSVIGDWLLGAGQAPSSSHTSAPGGPRAKTKAKAAAQRKVRIWDLPTRLFHWSLVAAISGALITPHLGETAMPWHFRCGYAALTLAVFRLMWGVVGTRHARFVQFVKGPRAVLAYLLGARSARHTTCHTSSSPSLHKADDSEATSASSPTTSSPGHNPAGALSVLAMLAVVLVQAGSGLFTNDDIASEGPLVQLIDKTLSDQISHWHAHITPNVIYALIGLHVLAVFAYLLLKRINLITPMVSGDKDGVPQHEAVEDGWAVRARALACLLCSATLVWWMVHL